MSEVETKTRAEVGEMDRDELVEYVQELTDVVDELQGTVALLQKDVWENHDEDLYGDYGTAMGSARIEEHGSVLAWLEDLAGTIDAATERLDEMEAQVETIANVGGKQTGKGEKISQLVAYAWNLADEDQNKITLTPENIEGATGVGTRYAYQLVDEMINGDSEDGTIGADGYDWATDPATRNRRPDQDTPDKGVTVDLDAVQSEYGQLNSFNNGNGEEGGSQP